MKLGQIFTLLIVILLASEIFSRRIRKSHSHSHKHKRHHSKAPVEVSNPVGNFFLQAFLAFIGVDNGALGTCISGLVGANDGTTETGNTTAEDNKAKEQTSVWENILNFAKTVVGFVCEWKQALWDLVTGLFNDSRRYRMTRLFYKGKAMYAKICWTCWIKTAYNTVVNTVTKAVTWAGKQLKSFKDLLTAGWDKVIGWVHWGVTFVAGLYTKIQTFLSKFSGLKTAVNCVAVGVAVINSITSLIENIPLLATPAAVLVIVKNLLCSIGDIIEMGKAIKEGWNATDKGKKWGFYGKAFGLLGKIFVGSKAQEQSGSSKRYRRHRRHRRLH
jgi:hypothetical protein